MDPSPTPRKEKKGLGRLWTKLKSAIRSKSKTESKTTSTASNTQPVIETQTTQRYYVVSEDSAAVTNATSIQPVKPDISTTSPMTSAPEEPVQFNTQPTVAPTMSELQRPGSIPEPIDHENTAVEVQAHQPVTEVALSPGEKQEMARRLERAQAIFRKYNIDFDEVSWEVHPKPQGERVFKAPRIRVRWTCHECKTTFGHDKICVECAHPRCKSCERYPPKKKKARAAKKAAVVAAMAGPPPPAEEGCEGACHECQTVFDVGTIECSNCHHQICERCLQETVSSTARDKAQAATTV